MIRPVERLRDPIERGEDRCDAWASQAVEGDSFLCDCGRWCNLDDGETLSPDPYAIPVCRECFSEEFPA